MNKPLESYWATMSPSEYPIILQATFAAGMSNLGQMVPHPSKFINHHL